MNKKNIFLLLGYKTQISHRLIEALYKFSTENKFILNVVFFESNRHHLDWTVDDFDSDAFSEVNFVFIKSNNDFSSLFNKESVFIVTVSKTIYGFFKKHKSVPFTQYKILSIDTYGGTDFSYCWSKVAILKNIYCKSVALTRWGMFNNSSKSYYLYNIEPNFLSTDFFCHSYNDKYICLFFKNPYTVERKSKSWFINNASAKRYCNDHWDVYFDTLDKLNSQNNYKVIYSQHPSASLIEKSLESKLLASRFPSIELCKSIDFTKVFFGVGVNSSSVLDCNSYNVPFIFIDHPATFTFPRKFSIDSNTINFYSLKFLDILFDLFNIRYRWKHGLIKKFYGCYCAIDTNEFNFSITNYPKSLDLGFHKDELIDLNYDNVSTIINDILHD